MRQPFFYAYNLGSTLFGNDFPKQTRQKPLELNSYQFFTSNEDFLLTTGQGIQHLAHALFDWHSARLVLIHLTMCRAFCG